MAFRKATRERVKLRLALVGPSGSGKTYTALTLARALAQGGEVAVIDTERGSASLYAGDVADFDTCELDSYEPDAYVAMIREAAKAGYPVLVIDSLSHAWVGEGGALDQVDRRGGRFQAWKEVTPMHRRLVDSILGYPGHVVVTMRSKTEYVVETTKNGKTEVRKVGLAPVQRDGLEYEFDVVGDMDHEHVLHVTKSRCDALADEHIRMPGEGVAATLLDWLNSGAEPAIDRALKLVNAGDFDGARELWPRLSKPERARVKAAAEARATRDNRPAGEDAVRDETEADNPAATA